MSVVGPLLLLRDEDVVDGVEVERGWGNFSSLSRNFLAFLVNLLTWTGLRVNNSLTGQPLPRNGFC